MNTTSAALKQALQDWHYWPVLQAYEMHTCNFSQLEQGLTNENWLVTLPTHTNDNKFVIRINAKNAEALNIHHQHEHEIVSKISSILLCPAALYTEPNYKYWVRPYIRGNTLSELHLKGHEFKNDLDAVANTLKQIHAQPTQPHWPSVDTTERTDYFWQQILRNPVARSKIITDLRQKLDHALQNTATHTSLCHMDTNTHNWIKDNNGKLNLIDWEYAGLGNPIWDLAVFSDSAQLNKEDETHLLSAYGEYSIKQLQHAKLQMKYLSILWFSVQNHTDNEAFLSQLQHLASLTSSLNQTL